jgi:hypothetical protein
MGLDSQVLLEGLLGELENIGDDLDLHVGDAQHLVVLLLVQLLLGFGQVGSPHVFELRFEVVLNPYKQFL